MIRLEGRLLKDIAKDIKDILHQEGLLDEYFGVAPSISMSPENNTRLWPERYQWVSVFPVQGSSEGRYVHVEIITPSPNHSKDGPRELIFLGKTFHGFDHSWEISKRVAQLLGA